MAKNNKLTRPQDACVVRATSNHVDLSVLLDLYQPIIGTAAANLYLTLHNRATSPALKGTNLCLHRQLVATSKLAFPDLIKARELLEAVGLLSTLCYQRRGEESYLYEYRLLEPLTGSEFFSCELMSHLLANRIDSESYQALKKKYTETGTMAADGYELIGDVTLAFDEVFNHVDLGRLNPAVDGSDRRLELLDTKGPNLKLKQSYLDLELIKGLVSNLHQLEKSLNPDLITKLNKLAFLYQFDDVEMAALLNDQYVYDRQGLVDYKLLRERALEKFQASGQAVKISTSGQAKSTKDKPQAVLQSSPADQHRLLLESYSPIQLIQLYQGDGALASSDLKIIDSLLNEYQLSPAVTNVLLEYVMLTNDYKLPRKLIEKIAAHWSRLNIQTVGEAMQAAKKERKGTSPARPKTSTKREELPDYILQQEERYHGQAEASEDQEPDPRRLAELDRLLREIN